MRKRMGSRGKSMGKRDPRVKAHVNYSVDNQYVPGGSTVGGYAPDRGSKDALMQWAWKQGKEGNTLYAKRDIAADIGTAAHSMIECYLKGYPFNAEFYAKADLEAATKAFHAYKQWEIQTNFKPVFIEKGFTSQKHKYGGTIDGYGTVTKIIDMANLITQDYKSLIDFKTSSGVYLSHVMQVCGYAEMAEENGYECEKIFVLHLDRDTGAFKVYEITPQVRKIAFEAFLLRRNLMDLDYTLNKAWMKSK